MGSKVEIVLIPSLWEGDCNQVSEQKYSRSSLPRAITSSQARHDEHLSSLVSKEEGFAPG